MTLGLGTVYERLVTLYRTCTCSRRVAKNRSLRYDANPCDATMRISVFLSCFLAWIIAVNRLYSATAPGSVLMLQLHLFPPLPAVVRFSLDQSQYQFSESNGTGTVCVSREGATDQTVTIRISGGWFCVLSFCYIIVSS